MNSRLDEVQAAILAVRLRWLPEFTERRRQIAACYFERIDNPSVRLLAPPTEGAAHAYHLFVVRCADRTALQAHLKDQGVQALIHYPIPIQQQASCAEIRRDPAGLAESERHANECLSIPCHPQMSDDQVERVVGALNCFVAR